MATERFDSNSDSNGASDESRRPGSDPVGKDGSGRSRASDAVAERLRKKIGVRRAISAWMDRRDP